MNALLELPKETVIDGEIVALGQEGKPAFHLLLGYGGEAAEVVLYAFDLLMFRGKDMRLWPFEARRSRLFERRQMREVYGVINLGTDCPE